MTRLLAGSLLFVLGGALWLLTRRRGVPGLPPPVPRLGLALGALGLALLASAQAGLTWSISALCFALVAVILLGTLLREALRR